MSFRQFACSWARATTVCSDLRVLIKQRVHTPGSESIIKESFDLDILYEISRKTNAMGHTLYLRLFTAECYLNPAAVLTSIVHPTKPYKRRGGKRCRSKTNLESHFLVKEDPGIVFFG